MEDDETKTADQVDPSKLPLFAVTVPEAIKRGENVMFTLNVSRTDAGDKGCVVLRQHEDFEWLHHNLVTGNKTEGVIIPPLPPKPLSDPKSAESMSRKQMGDNTRIMRGDQFEVDCKAIQKYLEQILSHPRFGADKGLASFLTEEEAPVRAKLSKGLITKLSSAIEVARKGKHSDIDEYFTQERHYANEYAKAMKEASLNYNKLLVAQWRLSSSYRALATELTTCTAERDEQLVKLMRILKLLSDGCEDEAGSIELSTSQAELTLGFYLELYARCSESLKDMHLRRTCALIDHQSCEKALEKAKPAKRAAAEEAHETAKKVFEETSEQAKVEIKSFNQAQLRDSSAYLTAHAELQIKVCQDFYSQLFHTRKTLIETEL